LARTLANRSDPPLPAAGIRALTNLACSPAAGSPGYAPGDPGCERALAAPSS